MTRSTLPRALRDLSIPPSRGRSIWALALRHWQVPLALAALGCSSDNRLVTTETTPVVPSGMGQDSATEGFATEDGETAGGETSGSAGSMDSTPDSRSPAAESAPSDPSPGAAPEGRSPAIELSESSSDDGSGSAGEATDPEVTEPTDPDVTEPEATDPETTDLDAPTSELAPPVPSAGCGQARTLQDGLRTITSSGTNRTYFLQTPDQYDSSVPHRLVFMFHWNFGSIDAIVNPPDADQNTDRPFYGMGDLSDDRTIFVVPQGLVSFTGGAGWANTNNQDVVFTDDMVEEVTSNLCIDESRVFTTGFSFGAAMSYKLACARADTFRAAAVYNVGNFSGTQNGECNRPIAYFATHGVTDGVAQYQGGLSILTQFAELNGCTPRAAPEPGENEHECVSFEGCSVPTRFCNFGNGQDNPHNPSLNGHYPSAKEPGEATSWIPAEAWEFITQF